MSFPADAAALAQCLGRQYKVLAAHLSAYPELVDAPELQRLSHQLARAQTLAECEAVHPHRALTLPPCYPCGLGATAGLCCRPPPE